MKWALVPRTASAIEEGKAGESSERSDEKAEAENTESVQEEAHVESMERER